MFPPLHPVSSFDRRADDYPRGITEIDHAQAFALINQGECLLIDVRDKDEYEQGCVIGALNLPLDAIKTAPLKKFPKDTALIVYCRSGRRSKEAAQLLLKQGFDRVFDMGGIASWPYGTVTPGP